MGSVFFLGCAVLLLGGPVHAQRRGAMGMTIGRGTPLGGNTPLFRFQAAMAGRTGSLMDGSSCSPSRNQLLPPGSTLAMGFASLRTYGYPGAYGDAGYGSAGLVGVVDDSGRYLVDWQRANLTRQHAQQASLTTRRRTFDEFLYERKNAPGWEDNRERLQSEEVRRSRTDPPLNEIVSARALNALLDQLQKVQADSTGDVPLDEDVLGRVNVTSGRGGNLGLLKDGRLHWPLALTDEAVKTERGQLDSMLAEALGHAGSHPADADAVAEMGRAADRISQYLARRSRDLPPGQYVEARRFLGDLSDAIRALQQPDAGDQLARKRAVRGKTVAELVRYMTKQGLHFAPATSGDEAAYLALHRALATYEASYRSP
jgi:hypothetical protein